MKNYVPNSRNKHSNQCDHKTEFRLYGGKNSYFLISEPKHILQDILFKHPKHTLRLLDK